MDIHSPRAVRAAALAAFALACAGAASASRVVSEPPPAASAVVSAAQQPAHAQADDSASLREATLAAVDTRRGRIRVHGIWLDAAKSRVLRGGRPVALDALKPGEPIRFTVGADPAGAQSVRVIYAP
jgi:hypothetical protein